LILAFSKIELKFAGRVSLFVELGLGVVASARNCIFFVDVFGRDWMGVDGFLLTKRGNISSCYMDGSIP
jgi:hypothetical protein